MSMPFRLTPSRLTIAYVALSVLALAIFAIPLWYGWNQNVATFKVYVEGRDVQKLVEVFDREGAQGLTAAMESRAGNLTRDEVMILADASKKRLAGNLPAWPAEVPDCAGNVRAGPRLGRRVVDACGRHARRVAGRIPTSDRPRERPLPVSGRDLLVRRRGRDRHIPGAGRARRMDDSPRAPVGGA